jgi:hypothetical protein
MSSKSIIASSHWRSGLVALGLVLLAHRRLRPLCPGGLQARPRPRGRNHGETPDRVTRELATGTLAAFVVHPEPKPVGEITFHDREQTPLSLAQWKGRVVLVNLWATWCGPCRKEMPELAELQRRWARRTSRWWRSASTARGPRSPGRSSRTSAPRR